jgi:hypothetical protein
MGHKESGGADVVADGVGKIGEREVMGRGEE